MRKFKHNKGMTIVELLVAISALVVLVACITPVYTTVVQNTKNNQDINKLESVCIAFKSAMVEPGVQKEVTGLVGDGKLIIICQVDGDGDIVFGDSQVIGLEKRLKLSETELWRQSIQEIGGRYSTLNKKMINRYIVFTITQKTDSSTAKCEYMIVAKLDDAGV